MSKFISYIILGLPSLASAAPTAPAPRTVNEVFAMFTWFNVALFTPTLILVGFITFIAGVVKFVGAGDDAEKRSSGQKVMVYGIVVLFVMISFWGFVQFFSKSFIGRDIQLNNYLPPLRDGGDING